MSACTVCGNSEAWHKRIGESTDPVDLAFAEEHGLMAIAKDEWEIEQAKLRLARSKRGLECTRILRDSRRARALHELAAIARDGGVLLAYDVGERVVTSKPLFNGPDVEIPVRPERHPRFFQQSVDFMPKAVESERFQATILRGRNVPDAFEYRV